MKYGIFFLVLMMGCQNKSTSEKTAEALVIPAMVPLSVNSSDLAIRSAITEIETKNIGLSGIAVSANTVQIEGIETVKISRADFFIGQRNLQEKDFANYMQYLERFKNSKNAMNDPIKIKESKAKHRAVLNYLDQQINKAGTTPEIYKVVYYLKAATSDAKYNQTQTIYLDEDFKEVEMDYSHLTPIYQ